ncbi:MAG: 5'-nucleotidase C-terminal domain-containing protein [Chthonomonas sp.]|nr:5'-nucleotidase C-terminal domain-containing protein [Chthonomonas sp.]
MERLISKLTASGILAISCGLAFAGPDDGAFSPAQIAADYVREAAGADAAFLAAGLLKPAFRQEDLSTLVRFPTDEIAVVSLTGAKIRAALERSVALYPSPSDSFLQLSNIVATFAKSGSPDSRLRSITLGGGPLDDARSYSVAMPATLARGGLGYFKIWDKTKITKTLTGVTLEAVLSGKNSRESEPRWRVTN